MGDQRQASSTIQSLRPELLWAVLGQLPVAVIVLDGATDDVLVVNERASELLGGESPAHRLPILAAEQSTDELRFPWTGADGRVRMLEGSWIPVRDADGGLAARVAVLRDATEHERRERLEREFVTNAAHELQTPVTAIISSVEVLQAGAKEIPADRDRFLEHVQGESQRLARLARSLLLLARVQTGEEVTREPVPLRPLLDDVALWITPAPGVEVRVRCPAGLEAHVDRGLLEQALLNVAGNAARHTREGSIRLTATRAAARVVIEVTDTGPGLPKAEVEQVFERFYRVEGRARGGSGLGLAIAREAVAALGGTIRLEPRRRGLRAVLDVPAAP